MQRVVLLLTRGGKLAVETTVQRLASSGEVDRWHFSLVCGGLRVELLDQLLISFRSSINLKVFRWIHCSIAQLTLTLLARFTKFRVWLNCSNLTRYLQLWLLLLWLIIINRLSWYFLNFTTTSNSYTFRLFILVLTILISKHHSLADLLACKISLSYSFYFFWLNLLSSITHAWLSYTITWLLLLFKFFSQHSLLLQKIIILVLVSLFNFYFSL